MNKPTPLEIAKRFVEELNSFGRQSEFESIILAEGYLAQDALLKEAIAVIKYCSSYSNTKHGLTPFNFMNNGRLDMEMANKHAVKCFEDKCRAFLAKIQGDG